MAVGELVRSAELCRQAGLETPIVSCGGSGSYPIAAHIPGVTEIQAGGAIFSDITYQKWGAKTKNALFVLASVTSRPTLSRAIVDAGRKCLNAEISMPEVVDLPGTKLVSLSAEHGVLELDRSARPLRVGEKINFVVGYGDFTIFLHDCLIGLRNGKVEVVWEILGRGKLT